MRSVVAFGFVVTPIVLSGCSRGGGTRAVQSEPKADEVAAWQSERPDAGSREQPRAGAVELTPSPNPFPELCPLERMSVRLASVDVPGGAALEFYTERGSLPNLHQSLDHIAVVVSAGAEGQRSLLEVERGVTAPPFGVPVRATVELLDEGARLVLYPLAPSDVEVLRAEIDGTASEMMDTRECPFLSPSAARETP